jgi:hypothetical protein
LLGWNNFANLSILLYFFFWLAYRLLVMCCQIAWRRKCTLS